MEALNGNLENYCYLAEIGADINTCKGKNNTAVHLVAEKVGGDIMKLLVLLDKGTSVNLTNTDEFTPLHISAQFGHLEATKFLFGSGAAINITNKDGNTPLMLGATTTD